MVPGEDYGWNAGKALLCMGNTNIEETGAKRKPSAGAAAFDGTVNPRGREE